MTKTITNAECRADGDYIILPNGDAAHVRSHLSVCIVTLGYDGGKNYVTAVIDKDRLKLCYATLAEAEASRDNIVAAFNAAQKKEG